MGRAMKRKVGLVRKYMVAALLSSTTSAVLGMPAYASDLPVKAPAAEPDTILVVPRHG